jgi:hypothetical protein
MHRRPNTTTPQRLLQASDHEELDSRDQPVSVVDGPGRRSGSAQVERATGQKGDSSRPVRERTNRRLVPACFRVGAGSECHTLETCGAGTQRRNSQCRASSCQRSALRTSGPRPAETPASINRGLPKIPRAKGPGQKGFLQLPMFEVLSLVRKQAEFAREDVWLRQESLLLAP